MSNFDPHKPFNDLPSLPPSADFETKAVLKALIPASRALAELKGLGNSIPDQTILINSLILQEAKASSEIENIVTTNDTLYKAFTSSNQSADSATKEVLRYRAAVWDAFNHLKERPILGTNLFESIVRQIKANDSGVRNTPGTKLSNPNTDDVVYTPPEGESVIRQKLADLEHFIHADDTTDPLIKLALIHYQFEAIHPFTDGNGRTGRIINILFLVFKGLLELPVLYLSRYIIENKNEYYHLLRKVTEQNSWEAWILFMLDAVANTAVDSRNRIVAIRRLLDIFIDRAKSGLPSRMYSKDLIELIFRSPYTKVQHLVDSGVAKRQTASEYLNTLEKLGFLQSQIVGREKLFLNSELFEILSK